MYACMFICDLGPSPKVTTPVCMHVHMHARVCVYAWAPDLALRHIICRYTMGMHACMHACVCVCTPGASPYWPLHHGHTL